MVAVFCVFNNTVEFLIIAVFMVRLPVTGNATLNPGNVCTTAGDNILGRSGVTKALEVIIREHYLQ